MCDTQNDEINDLNTSMVEALNEIRRLRALVERLQADIRILEHEIAVVVPCHHKDGGHA